MCLSVYTCEGAAQRMVKLLQVLIMCRKCAESESVTVLLLWSVLVYVFLIPVIYCFISSCNEHFNRRKEVVCVCHSGAWGLRQLLTPQ